MHCTVCYLSLWCQVIVLFCSLCCWCSSCLVLLFDSFLFIYMSAMYKCKIVSIYENSPSQSSLKLSPSLSCSLFWSAGPHSPSGSHWDWHETSCSRSKVISLHKLVVRYMPSVKWPSAKDNEGLVRMTEHQESQKQRKHRNEKKKKNKNNRQCFLKKISLKRGCTLEVESPGALSLLDMHVGICLPTCTL